MKPSNQDGQTTCPTCGTNSDRWGVCNDPFHGTGTKPDEPKATEKVYLGDKMGVSAPYNEIELPITNPADSLEQEIRDLLSPFSEYGNHKWDKNEWFETNRGDEMIDALQALIRRAESGKAGMREVLALFDRADWPKLKAELLGMSNEGYEVVPFAECDNQEPSGRCGGHPTPNERAEPASG